MALPRFEHPVFDLTLPVTNTKVLYRPFTVKEEKILLVALQSQEADSWIRAMFQVINNCLVNEVDLQKLPSFEIELLFLRLRAVSVDNMVKINIPEQKEDGSVWYYKTELDLNDVDIVMPEDMTEMIEFTAIGQKGEPETFFAKMKYPTFGEVEATLELADPTDRQAALYLACIHSVYNNDGTDVTLMSDVSLAEGLEYLETMSGKFLLDLQKYFVDAPSLKHTIVGKMKNEEDEILEKELTLIGVLDFFRFA